MEQHLRVRGPDHVGYSDGSRANVRSRFTELNPARAPLCMNSQFSNRNGWQLVCWIGGPAAARTWLKNSGDSTAPVSSRRFWSFHAGSMLRKTAGTSFPPRRPAGYQPKPNPSPLTVSAQSGEFSGCEPPRSGTACRGPRPTHYARAVSRPGPTPGSRRTRLAGRLQPRRRSVAAQAAQPSPQAGMPVARVGERTSRRTASHPRHRPQPATAPRHARLRPTRRPPAPRNPPGPRLHERALCAGQLKRGPAAPGTSALAETCRATTGDLVDITKALSARER